MERKTKVNAEDGKQDLMITREFDLPLHLLFRAYAEAAIIEKWMGTKVLKLESQQHGSYLFQTSDKDGKPVFQARGVIHEFVPDKKITRTFEMDNTPFGVQLEIYQFEGLSEDTSRLTMHVIYESGEQRDQVLKLPFVGGINFAHNRLQDVVGKLTT